MTSSVLEKAKMKIKPTEVVSSFIKKTYEMLEDQRFPDMVDWNEEGTALIIKKPTEFGQKVLPTYFKHSNLTSFVRQLNMYDFHKRRTQKYDHVYYHDLFQKGKKHLLKEIKRKNQDNTLANIQKAIETLESAQTNGEKPEAVTNAYENHLLKKLNKDALSRISTMENKIKDLTIQNQALWNQISHQNQREDILVSFLVDFMKKKGLSLDQLPQDLNNQFNLPHLKFTPEQTSLTDDNNNENFQFDTSMFEKPKRDINIADYFNFGGDDELSNSTEVSPSSPLSRGQISIEKSDNPEDIKKDLEKIISGAEKSIFGPEKDRPVSHKDWNLETKYMKSFANAGDKISSSEFAKRPLAHETLGKRSFVGEKENATKGQLGHKKFHKDPVKMSQEFNPYVFCEENKMKSENEKLGVKRFDSFGDTFPNMEGMPNMDLMDFC